MLTRVFCQPRNLHFISHFLLFAISDTFRIHERYGRLEHLAPSDFAAESNESADVVDHQCTSEKNRNVYDPVIHAQAPFPSIDPGILFP